MCRYFRFQKANVLPSSIEDGGLDIPKTTPLWEEFCGLKRLWCKLTLRDTLVVWQNNNEDKHEEGQRWGKWSDRFTSSRVGPALSNLKGVNWEHTINTQTSRHRWHNRTVRRGGRYPRWQTAQKKHPDQSPKLVKVSRISQVELFTNAQIFGCAAPEHSALSQHWADYY